MDYINEFILGDNLEIAKKIPDSTFDLVYLDPPFNTQRNFGDFNDKWKSNNDYVQTFLKPRIIEFRRLLRDTGSILIHINPRISHHIRLMTDNIFGEDNFKNEIIWLTGGNKNNQKQLSRYHDSILVYSKSSKYTFNVCHTSYDQKYYQQSNVKICPETNRPYIAYAAFNSQPEITPRPNLLYEWNGHIKQWYNTRENMEKMQNNDRLVYNKDGIPRIKKYLDELPGIPIRDVWDDIGVIQRWEKVNYATQKPISLLKRIIEIYSNKDDLIFDPFSGSGTTGRACTILDRRYCLIDINEKAKEIFLECQQKIIKMHKK